MDGYIQSPETPFHFSSCHPQRHISIRNHLPPYSRYSLYTQLQFTHPNFTRSRSYIRIFWNMRLGTRSYLAYEIIRVITLRVQSNVRAWEIDMNSCLMNCESCGKGKCSVVRKIFFRTKCSCPADRLWAYISYISSISAKG